MFKKFWIPFVALATAGSLLLSSCSNSPVTPVSSESSESSVSQLSNSRMLGALLAPASVRSARTVQRVAMAAAALPTAVDLTTYMPPIGDQGMIGSCVGWATSYAKTVAEAKARGWSPKLPQNQFSPNWIYNQVKLSDCYSGTFTYMALDLLREKGCDNIARFPYDFSSCSRMPDKASLTRALPFKTGDYYYLPLTTAVFKEIIAAGKPIIISFAVHPDYDALSPTNDVYNVVPKELPRGFHANCIVGYDDKKGAFKIANSWGTSWGVGGYGWLAYSMLTNSAFSMDGLYFDNLTIPVKYSITASAGANGTITPSGTVSVDKGSNAVFTVKANSGYVVDAIVADGVSTSGAGQTTMTHTFSSVSSAHTISATFKQASVPGKTYEAEILTRTSNVTTAVETGTSYSGGKSVAVKGTASGACLEVTVPSVTAGTYQIKLYYKTAANHGKALCSVDGVNQGPSVEMYASTVKYGVEADLGIRTFAAAGNKKLRVTVTGKNTSATGYAMHIDRIALVPVASVYGFEAEVLTRTSSGATAVESSSSYSGGKSVLVSSSAVGNYVEFTVPDVKAGSYNITVLYRKDAARPVAQCKISGTTQGAALDMYSSVNGYKVSGNFGTKLFGTHGAKQLRLTVSGKNAASTGYKMHIDRIVLTAVE